MFGINYKFWLKEGIGKKVEEYKIWLKEEHCWGDVELGYAPANDDKFMEYFDKGICNHPKRMYRPGNTVIVHFTPILEDLTKKYREGKMSRDEWERICLHTRQLSRGITDAITSTLQNYGREVSLLSEREKWSHACGADVAGMGAFEYKEEDEMFYRGDQVGFLGAVTTEVVLE